MNGIWSALGTDDFVWVKPSVANIAVTEPHVWWFCRVVRPLSQLERRSHIAERAPLCVDPVERAKQFGPLYWIEWLDGPYEGQRAIAEMTDETACFHMAINNL